MVDTVRSSRGNLLGVHKVYPDVSVVNEQTKTVQSSYKNTFGADQKVLVSGLSTHDTCFFILHAQRCR